MIKQDQDFTRELQQFARELVRYREWLRTDQSGSRQCHMTIQHVIPPLNKIEMLLVEVAGEIKDMNREPAEPDWGCALERMKG